MRVLAFVGMGLFLLLAAAAIAFGALGINAASTKIEEAAAEGLMLKMIEIAVIALVGAAVSGGAAGIMGRLAPTRTAQQQPQQPGYHPPRAA